MQEGMTRKRVDRGRRRDQGIARRWACVIHISFTLVLRYLGEGKKFHVLTKRVKKKIQFCLVWGFSNDLSNQGG